MYDSDVIRPTKTKKNIGFLREFVFPCEHLFLERSTMMDHSKTTRLSAKSKPNQCCYSNISRLLRIFILFICLTSEVFGCGYPGAPAHSLVSFSKEDIGPDTVATYECEGGFELLGPVRRICDGNSSWSPPAVPFCVLNVATGKAPMQSSVLQGGFPQKAVDGSTSPFFSEATCTQTEIERAPWWYVNLLEPYMIQLVRIDFGRPCCPNNQPATILVRVGNNRPDIGANPICGRYTGFLEEGRPLFIPCNPPLPGAFVSIHMETPRGGILSICEAFVYTDQALPIESCPSFRDQPPGSTATFNGKCYIFQNNQRLTFDGALRTCRSQGGSLVDETSPALQGFLSWELWRRHRNDPSGQYWMGAIRDPKDPKNWKWINGQSVTSSFWNLPGGNDNCSRFDGTKEWLWSDTNCNLNLNYICQYRPTRCGIPERPPNSTILATGEFTAGTIVEYVCAPGHILIGSSTRTCLPNGFYTESVPTCRYLQCGLPVDIPHGKYVLLNGTRYYQSVVRYRCDRGYELMGENELTCDVRQTWNGPPPRCEQVPPSSTGISGGDGNGSSNGAGAGPRPSFHASLPPPTPPPARPPVITITIPPPGVTDGADGAEPEKDQGITIETVPPPPAEVVEPDQELAAAIANDKIDRGEDETTASDNLVDHGTAPTTPAHFIRPYFPDPSLPEDGGARPESSSHPPSTQTLPARPSPTRPEQPTTNTFSETRPSPSRPSSKPPTTPLFQKPSPTFTRPTPTQPSTTTVTTTTTTKPFLSEVTIHPFAPRPNPVRTDDGGIRVPPITSADKDGLLYRPSGPVRIPRPPASSTIPPYRRPQEPVPVHHDDVTGAGSINVPQEVPPPPPPQPERPQVVQTVPERPQPVPPQPERPQPPSLTPNIIQGTSVVKSSGETPPPKFNIAEGETREDGRSNTRLNLGGIIALSVFGGFVVLAAFTTIIVILCRRSRRSNSSLDNTTISTDDSLSSESRGLNKYYKRAWENLRSDTKSTVGLGAGLHRMGGTIEGLRDTNEMTVNDATAWNTRAERKQKHHHHHHHHHNHNGSHRRSGSPDSIDGREEAVTSPWQNKHRRH